MTKLFINEISYWIGALLSKPEHLIRTHVKGLGTATILSHSLEPVGRAVQLTGELQVHGETVSRVERGGPGGASL